MNDDTNYNSPTSTRLRDNLSERLRVQIIDGKLLPGMRLPTRRELVDEMQASYDTVQRALSELRQDGFITTRGRAGTFVSKNPPHLCHYGLVFPASPDKRIRPGTIWSKFHDALASQASILNRPGERQVHLYYNAAQNEYHPQRRELIEDLRRHRLAGVIYADHPAPMRRPKFDPIDHGIPAVSFASSTVDGIPSVFVDSDAWTQQAVQLLTERGRRRIALLSMSPHHDDGHLKRTIQVIQEHGATTRTSWILGAAPDRPFIAHQIMHLLMDQSADRRPDGVIISDDNMVTPACAGLLDAGVKVGPSHLGGDCDVVAHANFPEVVPSPLPLIYLGYDASEILRACMNVIDKVRSKQLNRIIGADPLHIIKPLLATEYQQQSGMALTA